MSDHTDESKGETTIDDGPAPYERFQALTKRLLHVSKDDLREAEPASETSAARPDLGDSD